MLVLGLKARGGGDLAAPLGQLAARQGAKLGAKRLVVGGGLSSFMGHASITVTFDL